MKSTIPFNSLIRQNEALSKGLDDAYARVMRSGWYILGSEGARFEDEFAAYCGLGYAVGVASGSDALEIALRAVGIVPGQRVATVANAGGYATGALLAIGAHPCFIDIDPLTQLMSLDQLQEAVDAGVVDGVIVTHLFGRMVDVEAIAAICSKRNVPVIEDCAQAHGAVLRGRRAGSIGTVGCFSFYPTKNLGALGDCGAVVTNDPGIDRYLRELRQYGWIEKYRIVRKGGRNSRMDELQAAFLRSKLPHLDAWNERRRQIARQYSDEIDHRRVRTAEVGGLEYVAHLYVVCCEARNSLIAHLRSAGIGCDVHYPTPDNRQPAWMEELAGANVPITEALSSQVLSLPCYPELTDVEVQTIIRTVNGW